MSFHDLARKRYSVRSYKSTTVEKEKLERILETAHFAPTAANCQAYELIVISTASRKEDLLKIYKQEWFVQAPIVICACGVPSKSWTRKKDGKNYIDVDVAIVMDHLVLAATAEGLGTCWIAAFNVDAARKILRLPEYIVPIAFTPLGYASDQPPVKKRKSLAELVRHI